MTREIVDEDAAIDQVVERLAVRFPSVDAETIETIVRDAYAAFANAHVRDFVPVLVERDAKARLQVAA